MVDERIMPEMSVILTVVDGVNSLERCLHALRAQIDAPALEIIIPYDETIEEVGSLKEKYPEASFHSLGFIGTRPRNALDEHGLIDQRRAAGLRAATAPIVAMIEDRGPPQAEWARAMVNLHAENPHAVIGGGVVNKAPTAMLNGAFKCDYARYEPPAPTSERGFLTDINLSYKREPLMAVRRVWEEAYQEVPVHEAIRKDGGKLLYSAAALIELAREARPPSELLAERYHWGRVVAGIRGVGLGRAKSLLFAVGAALLPFILLYRIYRHHRDKGRSIWVFLRESPPLFLLLIFWSFGEFMGYIGRAFIGTQRGTP